MLSFASPKRQTKGLIRPSMNRAEVKTKMTVTATMARQDRPRFRAGNYENPPLHPGVEAAIKRGIEDSKAGRVRPWSEVKKDLGLG